VCYLFSFPDNTHRDSRARNGRQDPQKVSMISVYETIKKPGEPDFLVIGVPYGRTFPNCKFNNCNWLSSLPPPCD